MSVKLSYLLLHEKTFPVVGFLVVALTLQNKCVDAIDLSGMHN